ncbi:MAG: phosphodiester glycosidase family protein [Lachnospiraceae bacterium]|nr:phosphodiester glycosidase family protein [Lachnospiraceae bacterium]
MKKKITSLCFWTILIAFTIYFALDTFVIEKTYSSSGMTINTAMFETQEDAAEESTETSSSIVSNDEPENAAEDISITLDTYRVSDTTVYVADITLSSVQYLKTAFANDSYGRNITEKTSTIAKANDAILAINGDFYGAQESGYVIRNGIAYRDRANSKDVLCIYTDGSMAIIDASEKSVEELIEDGVWQAFCFGPALIEDSEISVSVNTEVGKAMASNPRTAIGIIDNNHFVFVVSDGRTNESEGLSLYELAEFMQSLGVTTAYNLDGGGSSTMYYNGEVVNNPTSNGRTISEREVSDIVYIG